MSSSFKKSTIATPVSIANGGTGSTSANFGTSQAVGVGTLEVGHATDTTLSRASAGVIAVEGVNV